MEKNSPVLAVIEFVMHFDMSLNIYFGAMDTMIVFGKYNFHIAWYTYKGFLSVEWQPYCSSKQRVSNAGLDETYRHFN